MKNPLGRIKNNFITIKAINRYDIIILIIEDYEMMLKYKEGNG